MNTNSNVLGSFKKRGWSLGYVSAVDSAGRTIWIAEAHRGYRKRFIVRADVRHWGSRAPSERVSALLNWQRRQEGPPEDAAGRRIGDSTPAGQRCVARAGRAQSRRHKGLRRRPADLRAQRRSLRAGRSRPKYWHAASRYRG